MWSAFWDFVSSAPFTAALHTFITAVIAAVASQHQKVSDLISWVGSLFNSKNPPAAMLLAAVFLGSTGTASAQPCSQQPRQFGPVRQFIHDHRPGLLIPKYDRPSYSPGPSRMAPATAQASPSCCQNGQCFLGKVKGRYCPNCTVCGDNCQCFGGGYYCPGVCPVQQPLAPAFFPAQGFYVLPGNVSPSCPSCQGGNCQLPSSRRR